MMYVTFITWMSYDLNFKWIDIIIREMIPQTLIQKAQLKNAPKIEILV